MGKNHKKGVKMRNLVFLFVCCFATLFGSGCKFIESIEIGAEQESVLINTAAKMGTFYSLEAAVKDREIRAEVAKDVAKYLAMARTALVSFETGKFGVEDLKFLFKDLEQDIPPQARIIIPSLISVLVSYINVDEISEEGIGFIGERNLLRIHALLDGAIAGAEMHYTSP
jgi:hypothetical protein